MDCSVFKILGTLAIAIIGYQIIQKVLPWLYVNIIGPQFLGPKVDVRHFGTWAVVTGGTDGIGKAYAKALAKKGLNLVLISRSLTKLEMLSKEIADATNVLIKCVDVDFTDGVQIYDKIKTAIEGLDIGVLVNNVGISYSYPEYFLEKYAQDPKFLLDIIAVNVHSVTHMCALVMPGMVSKKKGIVINIASTAAVIPNPLLSIYSGTKAFVNKFSVDLQTEYRSQGIIIQSVQPGFVATNMTKIRKPSTFAPSADTFVASALNTLGYTVQTAGYLPHALLQCAIHATSAIICEPFTRNMVLKNLLMTRKRALRNMNKKQ